MLDKTDEIFQGSRKFYPTNILSDKVILFSNNQLSPIFSNSFSSFLESYTTYLYIWGVYSLLKVVKLGAKHNEVVNLTPAFQI